MASRVFGGNADHTFDGQSLEDELNSITMTFAMTTSEITAFLDTYQVVVASAKKNVTMEIEGSYDATANQADDKYFSAIGGGVVTSTFTPAGGAATANNPKYQCAASNLEGTLVASHRLSLPVGDKAAISVSLQCSGSTTRETS